MSFIKILDNTLPIEMFNIVHEEFGKGIWGFSNRSQSGDINTSFAADEFCRKVNELISEKRFNESNVVYNLWNLINSKLEIEKNYKNSLHRIWLNGGPPLFDQTIHEDSEDTYSKDLTIIYFLHSKWELLWGGELLIYDVSKTRVTGGTFPLPNRAVVFPSYLPHRGVAVSRISPVMRISIAFQCKYDNTLHV